MGVGLHQKTVRDLLPRRPEEGFRTALTTERISVLKILHSSGPQCIKRGSHSPPDVRPEALLRLLGSTELECAQLVITELQSGNLFFAQLTTVEDERE